MALSYRLSKLLRRYEQPFDVFNTVEVSGRAIRSNIDFFKTRTGQAVIPVLKGNAYGHGIEHVAQAIPAGAVVRIAVDGYFEALRVLEASRHPVLVMGPILPQNYRHLRYDRVAYVVHDATTVTAIGDTGRMAQLHVEINSGMNRMGVKLEDLPALLKLIAAYPRLQIEGVMTHLADSDGTSQATVDDAVKLFDEAVELVRLAGFTPSLLHTAQTAASVRAHSEYANTLRLGIGTYGVNPFSPGHPQFDELQAGLKPALRLVSRIAKIIDLKAGDKVSYNYTFTAPRAMRIGVLPLGYYEGVNRALSNKGQVRFGDAWLPIVGRVCMNHTMIGLDDANAEVGDTVEVYGNRPGDPNAIDQIAVDCGLFNYNLLTSINADVRHILTKE